MFLPVFVHPGKRGPSPVKKSPEKSTAKGGPPAPPSTTSSALPGLLSLASHPAPLFTPSPPPPPPPASRMHVSPCTLSLRVKKYLRPPARPLAPPRPSARQAAFFPHTCVKASRPHTHVRTYARTYTPARASARGGDVRARGMRRGGWPALFSRM